MKRSKTTLLCVGIAAVLLAGAGVPDAVADYQCYSQWVDETQTYTCTRTRQVYRCRTANVCTTVTEQSCSWNPYLYVYECTDVERQVCEPERRCRWETETYTDTCTRTISVYRCTSTRSHTHSTYCTIPSGVPGYSSGTVTGSSDYTDSDHDASVACSNRQAAANRWLSNNPVCSCSNCQVAGLSGGGTRMSRGACTALNASANQWLRDNPVCSCSGCASAGLSGAGDRMSTSACRSLNSRAYNINNPVCSCSNCEVAGLSGGGTRMSRGACTALNASANQWLQDNPVCSCSGCASAGLSGAGDRMSTSACRSLNSRAYNINNPVCSCSNCEVAGLSGGGTRMSRGPARRSTRRPTSGCGTIPCARAAAARQPDCRAPATG